MTASTTTSRARGALGMPDQGEPRESNGAVMLRKVGQMEKAFQAAMPRGAEAVQLIRDVLTAIRTVPNLADCDIDTVLGSAMTCAQLGLRPNVPALGHAWILPFWSGKRKRHEAQLIVGYQGMVELAQRSGRIRSVIARIVYEADDFDVEYGLEDALRHKPALFGEKGLAIAYYAVAKFTDGGHAFVTMNRSEVDMFRARSKSRDNGPWVTDYDAMAMKTCVRQLFKWMPKATDLAIALSADESVRLDYSPDGIERVESTSDVIDHDEPEPEPAAEPPAPATADAAPTAVPAPEPEVREPEPPAVPGITAAQRTALFAGLNGKGLRGKDDQHRVMSLFVHREIASANDLTRDEASQVIDTVDSMTKDQLLDLLAAQS